MPPPELLPPACSRCGTPLPDGTPEGSTCEPCAGLATEENFATAQGEVTGRSQATQPPAAFEHNPQVIGDYEILGKLGQGGMGAVYRARQLSLDRVVALKILPSHLEEDENFVARFQREAAVAAGLNHANLVHVYASGCADGCHFIAMELVEGENLRQRLKRSALPIDEAVRICLEVARGLQFAWQRAQLIHRDIKPSNIYLAEGGTVKVGDLGLAKSLLSQTSAGLTHTGAAIGTPHYISPEQARGDKTIDLRADIYSLGCTLYELLTGATPYRGTDPLSIMMMHVNSPPPAIMKVLPHCPMPVGRLVNKMLRKSRRERHQTYEELIAAMEAAQQQLEQGSGAAGPSALVTAWREIGAAGSAKPALRSLVIAPPQKTRAAGVPLAKRRRWAAIATVGLVLCALGVFLFHHSHRAAAAVATAKGLSTAPPVTPSIARGTPSSEPWQDALREPVKLHLSGDLEITPEGLRFTGKGQASIPTKLSPRHGAMRMRASFDEMRTELAASGKGIVYRLRVGSDGTRVAFIRYDGAANLNTTVAEYPLPAPVQSGDDYELELRVAGQTLTAKLDGVVLGTITMDAGDRVALGVALIDPRGMPALIKKLELLDLDAPASAPASTRLSHSAEPWQDMLHDPTKLSLTGPVEMTPEGLRFTESAIAHFNKNQGPEGDGALRMLATFGGLRPELTANANEGHYRVVASADGKKISITRYDNATKQSAIVRDFPLREPLQPGADYEMELRVVRQTLSVKLNAELLGTVSEGSFPHGTFGLRVLEHNAAPTLVKALEVLDLGPTAANAPSRLTNHVPQTDRLGTAGAEPEQWQDLLADPAVFDQKEHLERAAQGAILKGFCHLPTPDFTDGAIRVSFVWNGSTITLLGHSTKEHGYNCFYNAEGAVSLQYREGAASVTTLRRVPLAAPLAEGWVGEMEFRLIGKHLRVRLNGQTVIDVVDNRAAKGSWGVGSQAGIELRSLQLLKLDAATHPAVPTGTDETTPATATKEAPFINSLGMKFVPVPITGGPTDKQRVLFSVWETRVQDYEVFVAETKHPHGKGHFPQESTHPVVNVSWDDAQEFCTWLTARERKVGQIGTHELYRLPTDHEWSCAGGIGEREDPAERPAEKSGKIPDVFPWGSSWPPPAGAGNFLGEECRSEIEAGRVGSKGMQPIAGYRDPFPFTSPVGSFAANPLMLYDLSGNVQEWCEDWFDEGKEDRVSRGGCWGNSDRQHLFTSTRSKVAPGSRSGAIGVRIVLAQIAGTETPAAATRDAPSHR